MYTKSLFPLIQRFKEISNQIEETLILNTLSVDNNNDTQCKQAIYYFSFIISLNFTEYLL
jgi:hypothetical protein